MAEGSTEKLELIIGSEGLERLQNATVMVLGLGGVGSHCVEALARSAIGHLIVLDCDIVQASNINRQAIAFQSTIGQKKTQVMAEMIADINPSIEVTTIFCRLEADTAIETLAPYAHKLNYLIDCIDTLSVKLKVALWAQDQPFKLISSMGAANKLRPDCIRVDDLYRTQNCRLCRALRKAGRKQGLQELKVVYSCEEPFHTAIPEGSDRALRGNLGTVAYLPAMMGLTLASEVIRDIALGG